MSAPDRLNQLQQYMDFYKSQNLGNDFHNGGARSWSMPGSAEYMQRSVGPDAAQWANQMMMNETPSHDAPNFFGGGQAHLLAGNSRQTPFGGRGFTPQTYVQPQRNQLAQFFGASRGK